MVFWHKCMQYSINIVQYWIWYFWGIDFQLFLIVSSFLSFVNEMNEVLGANTIFCRLSQKRETLRDNITSNNDKFNVTVQIISQPLNCLQSLQKFHVIIISLHKTWKFPVVDPDLIIEISGNASQLVYFLNISRQMDATYALWAPRKCVPLSLFRSPSLLIRLSARRALFSLVVKNFCYRENFITFCLYKEPHVLMLLQIVPLLFENSRRDCEEFLRLKFQPPLIPANSNQTTAYSNLLPTIRHQATAEWKNEWIYSSVFPAEPCF